MRARSISAMNDVWTLLLVQYLALTVAVWGLGAVCLYFVFTGQIVAMAVTFAILFALAWPLPRLLRQFVAADKSRKQGANV